MGKLLDEAIADANRVKTLAIENAKAAIAETFQPQIQRMVSAKIAEEDAEGDESWDDEGIAEEDYIDDGQDGTPADNLTEEGEEYDDEFEITESELDSMISELEGEDEGDGDFDFNYFDFGGLGDDGGEDLGGEDDFGDDGGEDLGGEDDFGDDGGEDLGGEDDFGDDGGEDLGGEDEEVIESLIRGMQREMREHSNKRKTVRKGRSSRSLSESTQVRKLQSQLKEANRANSVLKKAINEVNLLNAKLMYATKIIRNFNLNQRQQEKVLEAFDRSKTVNDANMIYKALAGQFASAKSTRPKANVSKRRPSMSTRPIVENRAPRNANSEYDFANRWKVIAGIKEAEL